MIISKLPFDKFSVLDEDTRSKQELADRVPYKNLKTKVVKLVAQRELDNAAGYEIEDENGRIHVVGYMFYRTNNIEQLFLPPIELPNPTMTIEEALIEMVKFAPVAIANEKLDAYVVPTNFVIAREVLGGRESGMNIFKSIVQIFKTRK